VQHSAGIRIRQDSIAASARPNVSESKDEHANVIPACKNRESQTASWTASKMLKVEHQRRGRTGTIAGKTRNVLSIKRRTSIVLMTASLQPIERLEFMAAQWPAGKSRRGVKRVTSRLDRNSMHVKVKRR